MASESESERSIRAGVTANKYNNKHYVVDEHECDAQRVRGPRPSRIRMSANSS